MRRIGGRPQKQHRQRRSLKLRDRISYCTRNGALEYGHMAERILKMTQDVGDLAPVNLEKRYEASSIPATLCDAPLVQKVHSGDVVRRLQRTPGCTGLSHAWVLQSMGVCTRLGVAEHGNRPSETGSSFKEQAIQLV